MPFDRALVHSTDRIGSRLAVMKDGSVSCFVLSREGGGPPDLSDPTLARRIGAVLSKRDPRVFPPAASAASEGNGLVLSIQEPDAKAKRAAERASALASGRRRGSGFDAEALFPDDEEGFQEAEDAAVLGLAEHRIAGAALEAADESGVGRFSFNPRSNFWISRQDDNRHLRARILVDEIRRIVQARVEALGGTAAVLELLGRPPPKDERAAEILNPARQASAVLLEAAMGGNRRSDILYHLGEKVKKGEAGEKKKARSGIDAMNSPAWLRRVLRTFESGLPADALRSMRSTQSATAAQARWLAGAGACVPDGDSPARAESIRAEASRRRIQAALLHPLLATTFRLVKPVSDAIDAGRPPAKALAEICAASAAGKDGDAAIPKAVWERLRGVTWQAVGRKMQYEPESLLSSIPGIEAEDPARLPSHGAKTKTGRPVPIGRQWRALSDTIRRVESLSFAVGIDRKTLLAFLPPEWQQGRSWLDPRGRVPGGARKAGAARADRVRDMLRAVHDDVFEPIAYRLSVESGRPTPSHGDDWWSASQRTAAEIKRICGDSAWLSAVAGRGSERLVEMSDAWHTRVRALEDQKLGSEDGFGNRTGNFWPPLTKEVRIQAPSGRFLSVVPLSTAGALREESVNLDHCVSTYTSQCLHANCHIVSIRGEDGKPVSTAELSVSAHGRKDASGREIPSAATRLAQHRAYRDGVPDEDAQAVLQAYRDSIHSGEIACDADGLLRALEERRRNRDQDDAVRRYGFDPLDKEAMERVFDGYAKIVGGDMRLGLDRWLAESNAGRRLAARASDPSLTVDRQAPASFGKKIRCAPAPDLGGL